MEAEPIPKRGRDIGRHRDDPVMSRGESSKTAGARQAAAALGKLDGEGAVWVGYMLASAILTGLSPRELLGLLSEVHPGPSVCGAVRLARSSLRTLWRALG